MFSGGRARLGAQDLGRGIRFWVEVMGAKLVALDEGRFGTVDLGSGFSFDIVQNDEPSRSPFTVFARTSLPVTCDVLGHRGVHLEEMTCEDGAKGALGQDSEGNRFIIREATAD